MDPTQNWPTLGGTAFETVRSDYLRTLPDTSAKNMRPVLERFETYLTRNGTLSISQEPGLGVTVDEAAPDRFRLD